MGGPFKGMRYVDKTCGSELHPKLLGTYELELHEEIERIVAAQCQVIINIGAAEGYYAVGLAGRLPDAKVICFEANAAGRHWCRRMAQLNEVQDRIEVRALCTVKSLQQVIPLNQKALVLCDCEGAEDELLDAHRISKLCRCDIIVETHEHIVPGVTKRLMSRFGESHHITVISSRPRLTGDAPHVSLPSEKVMAMMDEMRPARQPWIVMIPR
jgi:hypothetical protein